MITELQRLFDKFRRTPPPKPRPATLAELHPMRQALLESVRDCRSPTALRLHGRITRASTALELWALRADTHDAIARIHCQSVAAERIRCLEPLREECNT